MLVDPTRMQVTHYRFPGDHTPRHDLDGADATDGHTAQRHGLVESRMRGNAVTRQLDQLTEQLLGRGWPPAPDRAMPR